MKNLQSILDVLHKQEVLHKNDVFNYAIPEAWNVYGYAPIRHLRDKQILVNPYSFFAYTLEKLFQGIEIDKHYVLEEDSTWIKRASIYSLMIRCVSSWDHDRDHMLDHNNIYHLSDNGTFLKTMILLPLYKRMGINTILLQQPFTLGKTQTQHEYATKEAVVDFTSIDETLADPLLGNMDVQKQCAAFVEACHFLDMKVILEYCPGKLARENVYYMQHPEWFYWIDVAYENKYHAPKCHVLPQNTIPFPHTRKDLYKSEEVLMHIANFIEAPKTCGKTLKFFAQQENITIAPAIVDQINANIAADKDTTIFRFYEDISEYAPKTSASYMLQDTIRCDLYGGKKAIRELWRELCKNITWYQKQLGIDGLYIKKPYLLPEKLQKDFVKTAKKIPGFVMIVEESSMDGSEKWVEKGYDMISGNSGYEEGNLADFKFHTFAYRLKNNVCPVFAASEFYDARRISCLPEGKKIAILLTVMNHFLPNGIPMMLNGIESFDVQPLQLSEYGNQEYLYALPSDDERYKRQPYLDQYYFEYRSSELSILPNLLEKTSTIRKEYQKALLDVEHCIPVWFDSPTDSGIGFTFLKEDKALMVVCNVTLHHEKLLNIHTDNLFPNLPFDVATIQQVFSTTSPYIQDLTLNPLGHLALTFEAGEVKFIEFKKLSTD